jgi:hypothetical protein
MFRRHGRLKRVAIFWNRAEISHHGGAREKTAKDMRILIASRKMMREEVALAKRDREWYASQRNQIRLPERLLKIPYCVPGSGGQ